MNINVLKAKNGDAIHISYNNKNIIIDTGVSATYSSKNGHRAIQYGQLKEVIDEIKSKEEKIDLLIITHWDDDHIGGVLQWFNKDIENAKTLVQQVWFNSGILINIYFDSKKASEENDILNLSNNPNTSIGQGIAFEKYLIDNSLSYNIISTKNDEIDLWDSVKFTILSPTNDKLKKLLTKWQRTPRNPNTSISTDYDKSFEELLQNNFSEDTAIHNGSSIAFILEIENKKMLFLGDSHPSVIVSSLKKLGYSQYKKLDIEFMKVSHHGSKANTSNELLELINCDKFIISTDGSNHGLPNKETLARIINKHHNCSIYFNYIDLKDKIFTKEELESENFKVFDTSELSI